MGSVRENVEYENVENENSEKEEILGNKGFLSNTLSKNDLNTMLEIILVISKRGGFQLEEYKIVSELYEKLKLLLK